MSDSLERTKSDAKAPQLEGNGAQHDLRDDSEAGIVAPEGLASIPTLAGSQDKKPNTVALKKRAPVPRRAPVVTPENVSASAVNEVPVDAPVADSEPAISATQIEDAKTPVIDVPVVVDTPVSANGHVEPAEGSTGKVVAAPSAEVVREVAPTPKTGLWVTLGKLRGGWGWVLGAAAFGVALWGQKVADNDRAVGASAPQLWSWLLFALAGLLFVLGIAPTPSVPAHPTSPFLKGIRSLRLGRRILFLVLLFGGIAAAIGAVPLFYNLSTQPEIYQDWMTNNGSWILYVVALVMFGGAWVVWEYKRPDEVAAAPAKAADAESVFGRGSIPFVYSVLIMLALLVLALAIRMPGLDNTPPGLWFDEAQNGIVGRDLLAPDALHPAYLSGYTQMGALFFYLYGAVVKLFGSTLIWPLRFLPALAGSLIAPMLYLIGYRLFGWRVGVAAGVLVAVSAWNITMSRFGMASLPTVGVDVAAYLCLVQGLRTGRLGWYAGAGVLLGLALQMYYPAQLIPIVLVLVLAHRLISGRMRFFRAVRAGIVAFAIGALIAFIPVATFAVQHTNQFTERAQTISIFTPVGSEGRPDALQISIERHVLMFNYRGDSNPRHNLPGEPMLDWITAALFLAGVAVCALRAWRWQYFFALAWLLVNMSGGILSVVFEAPQSHRTLENSVVTALIAAIFLGELWTALDARVASLTEKIRSRIRKTREQQQLEMVGARGAFGFRPSTLTFAAPALLVLVWVGTMNIDRYFNKQANDMSVWLEMGGTNKLMALAMTQMGPDSLVYVSPDHAGVPATKYTAPNLTPQVWPGAYILPFTTDRNVELLFAPNDEANVLAVKRVYPNAKVDVGYGPNGDIPQFFRISISADDIKSIRGTQKIDDTHSAASLKTDVLNSYAFSWQGAGSPPQLMVDGTEILMGQSMGLALGLHSLTLTGAGADFSNLLMTIGSDPPAPIGANVLFDPRKVEPRGLTAYLRNGDVFDGPTPIVRVDPQVSFYFHEIPLGRPYTVEWIGKIYAPVIGTYGFTMEQLSRARLFIDDKEVLYNPTPNSSAGTRVDLQAGLHDIRIQYEDLDGSSHMYLYWTPPGVDPNERYIIPAAFLLPQMGSYPSVPASGAWPSVDEADDTLWARIGQPLRVAGAPAPGQSDVPSLQQPQGSQPTPVPPPNAMSANLALSGGSTDTLPRPRAAAVDGDGNIYIYTELDSKIKKFDKTGEEIAKWDVITAQGQPSTEGSSMWVKDGKLLLLESSNAELITYSLEGKEEARVHICDCFSPRGMAFSNDGNLWVTDTGFNKVDKVRFDGTFISSVGEKGDGPGQLIEPSSVWESPQGVLFVTDAGNKRVQSFGPDGKPIAQWPMGESTARDGNRLSGTSTGNALLTQYDSKSIIEYAPDGTEKSRWQYAPQGTALIPVGISTAGPNKYLVLFMFDNVAAVFDIGH